MGRALDRIRANDVVSAALLIPCFSPNLSTWRLTINSKGRLRQVIRLSTEANKFKGETVRRDRCVAMADLEEIVALAAEVGFGSFEEHYRADGVTGLWTKSISMRVPNGIKTVEAYGPEEMAKEEGNRDMAGFVALWERIHRQALYTWSPKG